MSKTVILLIGHGSRNPAGNDEFLRFAERLAKKLPEETMVSCFVELADVLIPAGIDRAVELGADKIIAVPVILLAAGHVKVEIPEILDAGRKRHPQVEIVYTRNIGVCDATVQMVRDRVAEAVADNPPAPETTGVLVLGRGSSDPDANGDLAKIARMVREQGPYDLVDFAFVGITTPDLPGGVQRLMRLGAKTVVVAPYFMFTGVLMERIHKMVDGFRTEHADTRFVVSKYFEFHERFIEVIAERIRQGREGEMMMACDTCVYRIEAASHHGHHHH